MRTIEEIKKEIEEYEEKVKPFQEKLSLLNDELRQLHIQDMERNIGKCFKYRNSYSCPKNNEYWYIYYKIIAVEDCYYKASAFAKTIDNHFNSYIEEGFCPNNSFIHISEDEFNLERENYLYELNSSILGE